MANGDEYIAAASVVEGAGKGGWPCGTMLFVCVLALLAFVVLPAMMGA